MRALIMGGGIGGLTAAIALRRKGIEAEVYEKSPVLAKVGAGIGLWPNAVKALKKIGLGDELDSISKVNSYSLLRKWDGAVLSRMPASDIKRRFSGDVIIVHRADLQDILLSRAGPSNVRLGRECTDIREDADGLTVSFADGSSARGDILIGADGLHSVVRTWLGHQEPLRYSGYVAWRAVVPFVGTSLIPGESWGSGRRFGMFPIHGGRVYWFAVNNAPEDSSDAPHGSRAKLLSLFKGWHAPVEELIRAADDSTILRNNIYDRDPLREWSKGRVTLLGDAAHPMTPNLGQGGCQAIEDALILATSLAGTPAVEEALQSYEAQRIPRTSSIVRDSRRFGALGQIELRPLCFLRDLAMRMTPASVAMRGMAPVIGYEGHLAD